MSWFSNQPCSSRREGTWSSGRDAWSMQSHAKATQSLHTLTPLVDSCCLYLIAQATDPVPTVTFLLCFPVSPCIGISLEAECSRYISVFVPKVFIVGLHIKKGLISYHLIFLRKLFCLSSEMGTFHWRIKLIQRRLVVHACNPSTPKWEAGGSTSLR